MLASLCGPDYALAAGDEHDFDEGEAQRLIAAGFAEQSVPVAKAPSTGAKPAKKSAAK